MGPLYPPKEDEVICIRLPALPLRESDFAWNNPSLSLITYLPHPPFHLPFWFTQFCFFKKKDLVAAMRSEVSWHLGTMSNTDMAPCKRWEFKVCLPIWGPLVSLPQFQLCFLCSSYPSNWLSSPGLMNQSNKGGSNGAPVLSLWFRLQFDIGILPPVPVYMPQLLGLTGLVLSSFLVHSPWVKSAWV